MQNYIPPTTRIFLTSVKRATGRVRTSTTQGPFRDSFICDSTILIVSA